MFLLDTNVLSEIRRAEAGRAEPEVVAWAESVSVDSHYVSAMTLEELERGVLLKERSDPEQGALLRTWLEHYVVQNMAKRTLPVDAEIARRAAALQVPDPAPFSDALIGATALVHGMAVVTRNVNDFERFDGLEVINPWEYESEIE